MKSSFLKLLGLSLLVVTIVIGIKIGVTNPFFSDTETSTNNTLSVADSFDPSPGDVVINEINWSGSASDGLDEWIELRNMTSRPFNLTNWVVENLGVGGPNANITITGGTIPANGFFLIARKTKDNSKVNVDPDFIAVVSLENSGEQLILKNNSNVVIDTANDTGDWFAGSTANPKKSMERKNPPGDGTVSTNWQTATTHTNMDGTASTDEFGTPKATNGL